LKNTIAHVAAAILILPAAAVAAQTQTAQTVTPAVPPGYAYQQPLAYPSAGQGAVQQAEDLAQCHTWADQNLGFDPRNPYESAAAVARELEMPEQAGGPDGSAVRGAARGAAAGALIGWATGNAGRGAAIGAASGGILGRAGSRRQRQAEKAAAEQAAKDYEQAQYGAFMFLVGKYDEGFALCMKARDYAVSE